MRDFARLRAHLRTVLLCTPFVASCSGSPKQDTTEDPGLVRNVPQDGSTMTTAVAEDVPLPTSDGNCGGGGSWCGPATQAVKHDSGNGETLGCPTGMSANGLYLALDQPVTEAKRRDGDGITCCYTWTERCIRKGRPLRDRGASLVAPLRAGVAWLGAGPRTPPAAGLHERLAEAWLEDALAEHASIASFARATLELMAVGAPPDLIAGCQRAALDEIRHAQRCFALAARYLGRAVEPGPLPSLPARGASLAQVATDTFLEGCVAETVATLCAVRALATCRDPEVAATLRMIVRDETRHAALAWRTVAWTVSAGGPQVAEALDAAVHALAPRGDAATRSEAPDLAVHGRLDDTARHIATLEAWTEIILPTYSGVSVNLGQCVALPGSRCSRWAC